MYTREKLNGFVLDLEFLLISVIQGVAITFLVTFAADPIMHLQFQYYPYIFSGFLFILLFWSQAVIHAMSFINWPLNLNHGFFYFLASFLEVLAFTQITHPLGWFALSLCFFIVAGVLYIIDLQMIKDRKNNFTTESQKKLFNHLLARQKFELYFFVPAGIIYSGVAFYLVYSYSNLNIVLSVIQASFSIVLLFNSLKSFKERSLLITNCIEK